MIDIETGIGIKSCVDLWDPKVIRSAAGAHFRLPVYCGVEWEKISYLLDAHTSVFIADSNSKVVLDYITDSKVHNNEFLQIPVLPYYSIEYATMNSITIIVGGETEGISEDCYRYAVSKNGLRINIPLQKGVDSLNTGMAIAVIVFEIKKQLLEAKARNKSCMANTI
ncbi:rRNA methyltransferase 3, mitochondrial [Eumeta japonica]|uniref:rRNA methyltransferase 3, mitochondrial n=1 Tax=Eumeta variegata TaxID=151549 RepID=A0A4C1UQM4_EUMVA|nr:rRNA methyltransferase 3, mitochondrial [Eumeta japonica]